MAIFLVAKILMIIFLAAIFVKIIFLVAIILRTITYGYHIPSCNIYNGNFLVAIFLVPIFPGPYF